MAMRARPVSIIAKGTGEFVVVEEEVCEASNFSQRTRNEP
jgi:hypothetical protein